MKVVPYSARYHDDFVRFNTDWILDNFGFLEEEDMETFRSIDARLQSGAAIFIAVNDREQALACCMTRPVENGRWEICKLGSNKLLPHKGAGSAVFSACLAYAESHGASELFLLSNRRLKPALHIYEKYGFHEIVLDNYEYERGDIAFLKEVA